MTLVPPSGPDGLAGGIPRRGAFAASEVLPMMQKASRDLAEKREEYRRLRDAASEAKSLAKKTRADLIVYLRVWGNEDTGRVEIKTSAERNEWANADADVQNTELAADLAQTAAMVAKEALDDASESFRALTGMLAIERDDAKREWGTPQPGAQ